MQNYHCFILNVNEHIKEDFLKWTILPYEITVHADSGEAFKIEMIPSILRIVKDHRELYSAIQAAAKNNYESLKTEVI